MSFENCLGSCSVRASVEAAQEACPAGSLDLSALADASNTALLTWSSTNDYESYAKLVAFLIPAVLVAAIGSAVLLDFAYPFRSIWGSKTRHRLSIVRDKHYVRGFVLFVASIVGVVLLLRSKTTGLTTGEMLSFEGTPNLFYSVQLLILQWLMAQALVSMLYTYRRVTSACVEGFTGLVYVIVGAAYWLFLAPSTSETRQTIGILLILTSGIMTMGTQLVISYLFGYDSTVPQMVDDLTVNVHHKHFLQTKEEQNAYRNSEAYKNPGGHRDVAQRVIRYHNHWVRLSDVLCLVGNALQFRRDPQDVERMALVQIDEYRCGTYWPIILFVVVGFIFILWGLWEILSHGFYNEMMCCGLTADKRLTERIEDQRAMREAAAGDDLAWHVKSSHMYIRFVPQDKDDLVGS